MRKAALLVFIAAFVPQAAAAAKGGIKVLNSIPDAYWGTWAPGVGRPCKEGDTEAIVLSAKAYAGPLGKCDVASVSETLITPPSARQPGAPSWYLRTFRYPNLIKSWANRSLRPQNRSLQYKISG